MRGKLLAVYFACLILGPFQGFADGGFIPSTAFAKVQIPNQRALIHFVNGTETLVIDTAFKGDGTNFAWVVPVPSLPKVEAASTGLFSTLQMIFRPKVVHDITRFYLFVIFVTPLGFYYIWKLRRGHSLVGLLLTTLILLLLVSMALPAFVTAGSSITTANVRVIDQKTVGSYETATLSSRDGQALLTWLDANGYVTPTNFLPAIRAYAQEGWFFVASKIRTDTLMSEPAKPHPLALTFKTQRPVYPLRLTGIGNESCQIDLYVFGPGRAQAPNFSIECCEEPSYPAEKENTIWRQDGVRIRHPGLRKLVDKSSVARNSAVNWEAKT